MSKPFRSKPAFDCASDNTSANALDRRRHQRTLRRRYNATTHEQPDLKRWIALSKAADSFNNSHVHLPEIIKAALTAGD
jgi:hypothetical protein